MLQQRSSTVFKMWSKSSPTFCYLRLARHVHESNTPQVKEQRLRRPLSPHLSIYQPQLTWLMSIGHRMTGTALAMAVYAFGLTYAVTTPPTGDLVTWVDTNVPGPLMTVGKVVLASPLCYHSLNGIRHLIWDCGWALSLRGCYYTGWFVNAGTVLGTALLALI